MLRRCSFLMLLLTAAGCDRMLPHQTEIAPYLAQCSGYEGQSKCLLTRSVGDEGAYLFSYDHFEGLQYQWGHRYVIEYTSTPVPPPVPEDASPVQLRVKRILVDQVVADGTAFEVLAHDAPPGVPQPFTFTAPGVGLLLGGPSFTCELPEHCARLEELSSVGYDVALQFRFVVADEIRLVLVGLEELP